MEIILDYREKGLICQFEKEKIQFTTANLLVGDIHIVNDGIVIFVIERKTGADYIASIKDHRLKNQMARVKSFQQTNPQVGFIILVEGCFQESFGQPIQISDYIYNSILHRILQDGIPVIRSDNLQESAIWIKKIANISNLKQNNVNKNTSTYAKESDYLETVAVKKSDNMTPENCYLLQLTHIPGVSLNIAKNIAQFYPSWASLINKYQTLTENQSKLLLADIQIKQRRLGKTLSAKIYQYLFPLDKDNSTKEEIDKKIEFNNKIKIKLRLKGEK